MRRLHCCRCSNEEHWAGAGGCRRSPSMACRAVCHIVVNEIILMKIKERQREWVAGCAVVHANRFERWRLIKDKRNWLKSIRLNRLARRCMHLWRTMSLQMRGNGAPFVFFVSRPLSLSAVISLGLSYTCAHHIDYMRNADKKYCWIHCILHFVRKEKNE